MLNSYFSPIFSHLKFLFLGGLSLHLNHLIAERVSAPYRQFGTLPIGIFCQIWTQDSLRHLLWHLIVTFEICQLLATPGPFEYFGQNWVSSENQSFLDEGAMGLRCDLGVLGSQITRLYDGTIFGGGAMHLRGSRGPSKKLKLKNCIFQHICDGLKGIQHLLISSRITP